MICVALYLDVRVHGAEENGRAVPELGELLVHLEVLDGGVVLLLVGDVDPLLEVGVHSQPGSSGSEA